MWLWVALGLLALVLAACGASATQPVEVPVTVVVKETGIPAVETQLAEAQSLTSAPAATTAPSGLTPTPPPSRTADASAGGLTPTPLTEARVVELEWPPQMRLGDSDLIRLALIPSTDGYVVTTEFPDHVTVTSTVPVARPGGYALSAVARLDATGFEISPQGEQALGLPLDEIITWRWTITPRSAGQHRVSISLLLRWTPQAGNPNPAREVQAFTKGIEVRVTSFLGLTTAQAASLGIMGLMLGSVLSLPLTAYLLKPTPPRLQTARPNAKLVIEPHPAFTLTAEETALLQILFRRYARLTLTAEFRSGYSGARTVLARPVHADGRADAYTIAKLGDRAAIQREFENYERFVKDTLPPITARIQETPITLPSPVARFSATGEAGWGQAALRYTFIGESGQMPTSLREALLATPDPALLEKLFATFGPNWWMQRKPYSFRLAQEYDRMLPAHYILKPAPAGKGVGGGKVLDGKHPPSELTFNVGEVLTLQNLMVGEKRPDGRSLSLVGETAPGQPPVRARWLALTPPGRNALAYVVATRAQLLQDTVKHFDRIGLPDPLLKLPQVLYENVSGTQATVHGDLNLENILVGPGQFVWLIDFAQTRDGHTLYDFAHLAAGVIAHVIAPQTPSIPRFLALLHADADPLLKALRGIAAQCLANPHQPREYDLALFMACVGALKFGNLDAHQKQLLYLAAAHEAQSL